MSKTSFIISIVVLLAVLVFGLFVLFSGNKKEVTKIENKQTTTTENSTPASTAEAPTTTEAPTEASGFKIEVLKQGTGDRVTKAGDGISVNYIGTLANGTKFDSSYDRNQPFKFDLDAGQVIKGWDRGLIGMKVGEKRRLTIPPTLGYGSQAMGDKIPANSTLIFEVELLEII